MKVKEYHVITSLVAPLSAGDGSRAVERVSLAQHLLVVTRNEKNKEMRVQTETNKAK